MNKGFTLVEMLVVLTVIGLLAAMALPRLGNMAPSAADSSSAALAGALGSAAADYNAKCKYVPGYVPPTGYACATPSALRCDQATITAIVTGIRATDFTVAGDVTTGCTIRHTALGTQTYTSARID